MSNHRGVQLVAPKGFEQMEAGRSYHLLVSDAARERVVLVYFSERPMRATKKAKREKRWTPLPVPVLVGLRRASFEHGLTSGAIVRSACQHTLPPWLGQLEGRDLPGYDASGRAQGRSRSPKSHQDRIDRILATIWPLVKNLEQVLGAEDPAKVINAHARTSTPRQNESRVRLWLLTFVAFGFRRDALHYPIHKIGHWNRTGRSQKLGRPSLKKGAQQGFNSADPTMIEKILEGYRRYSGLGVRMSTIYEKSMRKVFGCESVRGPDDRAFFVHPDGHPFPTYDQFNYRVIEHHSIEEVQRILYGSARYRNRLAPSLGRFTESVGNLMERTEVDGYWVEEIAGGYLDGKFLPTLCAVRIRCVASGMIVGIGFSVGGETGEAYRMALFCAAVDKVRFCALFGFTIEAWQWPSIGLPPHIITDRGAGSTRRGQIRNPEHQPASAEIAPSYSGQSKAIVEASHPRDLHLEGQPSFKTTSLTLTQLALREVVRSIADNDSKDVSSRLNNEEVCAGIKSTPLGLWNHLDALCRNDAQTIPFEAAVRELLTPIELDVKADGVYLEQQRYDGPELRGSGLLDRVATTQATRVQGYMFAMAVRQVFVETGRGLVEVPAMLNLRSDDSQLWISIFELQRIAVLRRQEASLARPHRAAVVAGIKGQFETFTGHEFDSRARRSGRPKRGSTGAKEEAREAKTYVGAKGGRS
jgi:hypothetical protein